MRLVDVDAAIKANTKEIGYSLWLRQQPTAFDVERVVTELTDKKNECALKGHDGAGHAYDDACATVRCGLNKI